MADEKDMTVVETNTVNPKQAVNVLENIDKVSAATTPVATLQNNTSLFKQEENTNFMNSDAWNDYMTDTFRAYNSKRYPGFAAIEETAANPAYSTIINRYGKAIADRAQAIHSTYAKANNWFGRVADAYDAPRYEQRAAAARKDLSDAIRSGDEAAISRAKIRYENEQRKSYEEGTPFEEYGNTLMSLLASMARNPETIPVEIAGAIFAPVTYGGSEVAARAINAAIVGADTFRVEAGSDLERLDVEAPDMSEEEKFATVKKPAWAKAAIEAGLFGLGGNLAGRTLKGLGKEVAVQSARRAVKRRTGETISSEAAKDLIKTDFIKALQKPAEEQTFKKTVGEMLSNTIKSAPGEGLQEVLQDSISDAMLNSVKGGATLSEELLDDWADFIVDPFSERHADKWETFINVSLASLALGGGFSAANLGVRRAGDVIVGNTQHNGTGTFRDKASGAYNNTLGLSKMFDWHRRGESKAAIGTSNAVLEKQIERGELSGKLYTTVEQVREMQQDPEVAAALDAMGVATSLSEAADNGGVVEIDLLAYDKVVNESQNTVLFQKMRNYLSFSDTTMSLNEFSQFINSKGKQLASIITDEVRNDQESVYNRLKAMALNAGRNAERAEGYAVLGHILLSNMQAFAKGERNDILDRLSFTINQGDGQVQTQTFGTRQKSDKQRQFDIIQRTNPANPETNVTWIRSVDEIKTLPETLLDSDYRDYDSFGSDLSRADIENAIKTGKITVYSSHPIEDGAFVTPSQMEAKDYAGGGEVYSKEVNISDVAWIDPTQGMMATISAESGAGNSVDVDVGGMVNDTFTEESADNARVYHMFVGSRNQDTANDVANVLGKRKELDEARAMEQASIAKGEMPDYEAIWEKTGWYKEPDTSWSYEIADNEAGINEGVFFSNGRARTGVHTTLGKAIRHDKLFDLFPELKDIPFHIGKSNTSGIQNRDSLALYHGGDKPEIIVNASALAKIRGTLKRNEHLEELGSTVLSTILHELQHAIDSKMSMMYYPQYRGDRTISYGRLTEEERNKLGELDVLWSKTREIAEKYGVKGLLRHNNQNRRVVFAKRNEILTAAQTEEEKQTVRDFVDKYIETQDYNIAYNEGYYREAAEVHARNTQTRLSLTEEQRKQVSPSATVDISGKVQVGRSVSDEELSKNVRVLNVIKFAGVPVTTGQQGVVEAGRTTAREGMYEIALTPDANVVTFAHELFHVFSLELQRIYNNGTITDYWKKQAEKMFKIAGAEVVDGQVALLTSQEEHLANMFTTYIMKGRIENQEVRGLLAKLIDMFKTTYRQLDGAGLTPMALDSKALDFFNSVLSTQDAIEEIQRDAGLLEILPPEGVDRELYDYYIANLAISKVEASNDLRKKLFRIDQFKQSAEYTKLLQKFKDEAKAELLEEYRYKILAQASLYETDKAQQTLLWAENNMPESNLTLGDITEILEKTPSLEEAANNAAEAEMNKYIAREYKLTPQEVGFKEERNRAKVRALLAESVIRRNGTIADIENEIKRAEAASDKLLAKTSVYQIMDLGKWKNREAAAVERYAWARSEGRQDLMSAERYNQAVLNLIMIKSAGFKNEYQKLTALFDKLQSKQKKYQRKDERGNAYGPYEHRYNAEDWELLRSISEKFGNKIRDARRSTKTVHQQMKDWIQTQVENRFTAVAALEEFIPFIDRGSEGSIGSMRGGDFKKLWAVMHTIDSIAMREQQLFLDGQYEEASKYSQLTQEFYKEKNIKTDENKNGWYNKFFGRYGTWQNPEPLLRAIFPPEVFRKIFLPMFDSAIKSEAQAKVWIDTWRNAKKKINTSNEVFTLDDGTQITYGETSKKTMTYADVANLLIAMGAEHSYENYKLKFGLTDAQAEQIASQAIKRNHNYVEFMNTTWKVYGEATESLNSSFQERTNELFVRKEHRPFTIDGIKFDGGYVPEDKHYIALVRELGTWNQGMRNKVENKNEKLINKLADGNVLSIIDITETKLSQSAKWSYAAIPYNNVKKFVEREEISQLIGERAFNFIRDWLQNWDTPHIDESGVWRPLTRVTTIAALGARASTALLQVSGLAQSFAALGPTYLARGMLQFVREGGFFHPFKGPASKSLYMATRVEDPFAARFGAESQGRTFREIFASYNAKSKLGKVGTALLSSYQTLSMMGIQIIDGWVATITWNGAYRRALDQGMTEQQARSEADSVVRITQSDATQISRSSAMQEPWARSVTAFATWTMAMRSQVNALTTSKSYRKDLVMFAATYAVVSTFIEAFLKETTEPADDGEEDKKMLERVIDSWYNKIVEAVGTQAMPFAGLGAAGAKAVAAALANTDDDKIFRVFAGGSVPALQYASRATMAAAQTLQYLRSGEEEDRNKMLEQTAGLVSYEMKKRVKQMLED